MTPRIRISPAGLAPRLAPNLALALALALALVSFPAVTQAGTITVDGDTVVIAADGLCSLREAIHNANADAQVDNTDCVAGFGFDVIQLGNEEAYVLPDADAFFPESGLPVITSTLRIEGNGSSIERSGACNLDGTKTADEFRLLTIQAGGTSVTLQDLTLRGGCADGGGGSSDGGAIWAVATNLDLQRIVVENNQAWDTGGGLIVGDSVTRIEDSTFRGNSAGGGGGGIGQSDGDLTLLRSTVSGNTAGGDGGGGIGTGGTTESMLTIVRNSTISGNTSTGAGGGGGGLGNTGDMRVDGSTVTGNSATGLLGGGGIGNGGILILNNSLVAGNGAGGDCSNLGLVAAAGVNFDSDGTCAAEDVDVTTVTSEALALRPLAQNGGLTETHDLAFGSVAIDAVLDCITTVGGDNLRDQRDFDRPQDGDGDGVERCDVGAVESSEVLVVDGTCTLGDAIEAANADNVTVGGCVDQATGDDTILLDVDTVLTSADTVRSTLRFGAYAGLPDVAGGLEIRARNASVIERDEGLSCGVPDGPDEFRLLQMATTIDPPRLELAGVTLRGGCADKGGALLGFGRLDIVDSHFLYNTAISTLIADGGAVFASEADVTISGSYFRGNTALGSEAYGGAVYASDLASLTTSQFVENLAESTLDEAQGGALYTSGGVGELREVVFDTNQARGQTRGSGGGFRINFVDSMNQVVLSHNEAFGESVLNGADSGGEALGGGAYLEVVNLATDVTLVGNLARGGDADSGAGGNAEGGGLYLASEGTLRSLTFSDNRAEGGDSTSGTGGSAAGGGVRVDGDYRLENSTLALNEAVAGLGGAGNGTATGGGLLAAVGMTLGSSLLEQNTTDVAGAVTNSDCGDLGMHLTSLGYNAVAAPTNCTFSATGDQTGVASSLLPLGDHGCASTLPDGRCIPTHPVALGSDAIDKGSCTASGVTADIREFVRPIDFTGITDGDDGCDVGAYESRDLDEGAGDGVEDGVDNCPNDINPSQQDGDGDGYGDECDLCVGDDDTGDADGDGVCADLDCADSNPSTSSCTIFVDGFESGDTTAWSATVF